MAIDQFVKIFSGEGEGELVAEIQSLLVIKRSAKDGKVLSISEEEGHRKVSIWRDSYFSFRFLSIDALSFNFLFFHVLLHSTRPFHRSNSPSSNLPIRKATVPLAARAAAAANFYSPTDNMVSPTTSKLNLAKKKHHMKWVSLGSKCVVEIRQSWELLVFS